MVARVEPSYNVVSLFKTLKGEPSASTAAVDAIIEQVRKINAAASNARLQGVSAATEAWFSQADPDSGEAWIKIGDVDLTQWRSRFSNDTEYQMFTRSLASYDKDGSITTNMLDGMADGAKIGYKINVGTQGFLDKATSGGSQEVYDLIKGGEDVENLASAMARYNWYSSILTDGNNYIAEKTAELANTHDESAINRINTDLEIANGMIRGKQEFIDNFQTYLDYATWIWSAGSYNLSGSLYEKKEDGTYSPGAFDITLKGGSAVYWSHDGSGTALKSNPFGEESEVDLLYMDNYHKKYTSMSVEDRIESIHENYPYRVVRDGQIMYSNKPVEGSVKI